MIFDLRREAIIVHRYRLYREHKYIFYVFSESLKLVSTLDFSKKESLGTLKSELKKLEQLLQSHAEHEENRIHLLLKNKNSQLFIEAENQHRDHNNFLLNIIFSIFLKFPYLEKFHLLKFEF